MNIARLAVALTLAAASVLAFGQDFSPGGAAAALPTPAQLAQLVFPRWSDSAAGRVQTVTLARSAQGWGTGAPMRVLVAPKVVLRGAADQLTLIAGLVPAREDGAADIARATPMGLAAYRFRRTGTKWQLNARQEGFDYQGFFGEAKVHQLVLSNLRRGIAVEAGSCFSGYCGAWMSLYELDDGKVRPRLIGGLAVRGSNVDTASDCAQRLAPLVTIKATQKVADADASLEPHDCYAIDTTWSVAPSPTTPGELTIHYRGAISHGDARGPAPLAIDQRQVLR
jgi:hypothetical protein